MVNLVVGFVIGYIVINLVSIVMGYVGIGVFDGINVINFEFVVVSFIGSEFVLVVVMFDIIGG